MFKLFFDARGYNAEIYQTSSQCYTSNQVQTRWRNHIVIAFEQRPRCWSLLSIRAETSMPAQPQPQCRIHGESTQHRWLLLTTTINRINWLRQEMSG